MICRMTKSHCQYLFDPSLANISFIEYIISKYKLVNIKNKWFLTRDQLKNYALYIYTEFWRESDSRQNISFKNSHTKIKH